MKKIILLIVLAFFIAGCTEKSEEQQQIPEPIPEVIPEPIEVSPLPAAEVIPPAEEQITEDAAEEEKYNPLNLALEIDEEIVPRSKDSSIKRINIKVINNGEDLDNDIGIRVYTLKDDETETERWYFDSNKIKYDLLESGDSTLKTARASSSILFNEKIVITVVIETLGGVELYSETKTVAAQFI